MKYDKDQIIKLNKEGKTYQEISQAIGCSKWTIDYHLNPNRKNNQVKYQNTLEPLYFKRKRFLSADKSPISFSLEELKEKIGKNPKCHYTKERIDLNDSDGFSLDHIIPLSRGGKSSLDNLAIVKKQINQAKYNMLPEEFISMCKKVAKCF